jgi:hypothetical protein
LAEAIAESEQIIAELTKQAQLAQRAAGVGDALVWEFDNVRPLAESMFVRFSKGLWKGWEKTTIGDACWVPLSPTGAGLMANKGTLCILISCHIYDLEEAQRVAFSLAETILAKEARRGEQEPAPQAYAAPIKKFRVPELDAVLLEDTEVSGFAVVKQNEFKWWKGRRDNGEVLHQVAIFQEFRDPHGSVVFLRYARFSNAAQAREACEYYPKHVNLAFREGLWRPGQDLPVADASWVCQPNILMVQKGSLCALISCYIGDREEAQRLALSLAQKILTNEAPPADEQKTRELNKDQRSP